MAGFDVTRTTEMNGDLMTMTASTKALVPEFPAASAQQAKADLRALADVAVYLHAPTAGAGTSGIQFGELSAAELQSMGKSEALLRSCRFKAVSGNDLKGALSDCQAAVKLEPDSDDAKMGRGFVYLKSGRYDAAIADYGSVLQHRPNSPTAHFGLGQAELKSGAAAKAQADIAAARAGNANIDTDFYGASPGQTGKASIQIQSSTSLGLLQQGETLASQRNYVQAIENINAALKLDPKSAIAYAARGLIYAQEKRNDLAGQDFDKALQLDPKQPMALGGKGAIAEENGDLAKAVEWLAKALEAMPDMAVPRAHRAQLLSRLHRYDDALKDMNLLIGQDPNNAVWLNDRCWYRAIAGKELGIALADCDASLKIQDQAATRDSRGMVDLRLGKFDDAVTDYDKALSLRPNMPTSLYGRGIAKLKNGTAKEGQADITAALAIDPKVGKEFAGYGVTP